jgi:hypothetical protein
MPQPLAKDAIVCTIMHIHESDTAVCIKFNQCHVWAAPAMQEESDVSANRSGAAMYPAFECSRYGRWP